MFSGKEKIPPREPFVKRIIYETYRHKQESINNV